MAQRVRIGPGAGSPLLVSVSGVNADGSADFTRLIFDGNCPPLRVWHSGYVQATQPANPGALALPYPVKAISGYSVPNDASGNTQYPLVLTVGVPVISGSPVSVMTTPYRVFGGGGGGFGGVMANDGAYYALNMGNPSAASTTYVSYCILRNYG